MLADVDEEFGDYAHMLEFIDEWNISSLKLESSDISLIFKSIRDIRFPSLKVINFFETNVETIEFMSWIHLPVLAELTMSYNRIHSAGGLVKGNYPNIIDIRIRMSLIM